MSDKKFLNMKQELKQELRENKKSLLDDISDFTKEINTLKRAKTIRSKLDKGEHTTEQEKEILKNTEENYKHYFQDTDLTSVAGLKEAISDFKEERNDVKERKVELEEAIKKANKLETIQEEENNPETIKEQKKLEIVKGEKSKHDDSADLNTEMPDYMDTD